MHSTVEGRKKRNRQKNKWEDNVPEWKGLSLAVGRHLFQTPKLFEIKAQHLPPYGEKMRKIVMLGKNNDILSAGDAE